MEIRGYVPDVDVEGDDAGRLLDCLDRGRAGAMGPVLSGAGDGGVDVILSAEVASRGDAAAQFIEAVEDGLDAADLDTRPVGVELEPA